MTNKSIIIVHIVNDIIIKICEFTVVVIIVIICFIIVVIVEVIGVVQWCDRNGVSFVFKFDGVKR